MNSSSLATATNAMNTPLSVEANHRLQSSLDRDEDRIDQYQPTTTNRFDVFKHVLRRKQKRPASLMPLGSPQHTPRTKNTMNSMDQAMQSQRPSSPALPPLVVNVLERKRLFLNTTGESVVGVEEILQLQELLPTPRPLRSSPLQLIAVPRKVFDDDEVALMPCHSLHYRYVPSLEVEKWKEPIRDREKNWRDDELAMILTTLPSVHGSLATTKMTRGPSNVRKGTWRKLDSQRLQIPSSTTTTSSTVALEPPTPLSSSGEVLLRVQGGMISKTYCIVTIYGIGIYGRIYSEGLIDRDGTNRCLRIQAYDPTTSRVSVLKVSLADLEWVFQAHPDLLAPGRKQEVLRKIVSLLYFQYADENEQRDNESSTAPPILCISPEERLNDAARRRYERDERLRREEEERLRLLALLMKLPRRARHRVAVQLCRISGHECMVSIYHFPSQVRSFLIVAYHPRTSRTLTLAVGVREAALQSRILSPPHTWTSEQKTQIAAALIPNLFFRAIKSQGDDGQVYRMALAVQEDRRGTPSVWLTLPMPKHAESRKHEVMTKYTKDGQQTLRLNLEHHVAHLELTTSETTTKLRTAITDAENTVVALTAKDTELQERIEEINSGHGMDDEGAKQQHALRRGHKAARKTLKDERKTLEAKILTWKRELEVALEHAILEQEKMQTGYEQAITKLTQEAETATLSLWFDPVSDRKTPLMMTQKGGNTQRHRLPRAEIRETGASLASGACVVSGRRMRFSVVAESSSHEHSAVITWFQLFFYDASTSHTVSLRLTRLEWLAFTKSQYEAQVMIGAFSIPTSPIREQLETLDTKYETTRHTLRMLPPMKKNDKKRRRLRNELEANRQERRVLWREQAPWDKVVRSLCQRLSFGDDQELVVDRCLYRSTLGIVSVVEGSSDDSDGVVDCEVWVTQVVALVTFHARDPVTQEEWSLEYPESVELVKEFAVETALELQMHLEAIAMTLLMYVDDTIEGETSHPTRKMRFED